MFSGNPRRGGASLSGRVLANDRETQVVQVQPHAGCWDRVKVVHRSYYQTRAGYVLEVADQMAVQTVSYAALVKKVQLLKDGELGQADARRIRELVGYMTSSAP